MAKFVRVPGKGRVRATIEKVSRRVSEEATISVSTEKWINPCEYRGKVESLQASKKYPDDYRKRVQSVCVPNNGIIRASTGKM